MSHFIEAVAPHFKMLAQFIFYLKTSLEAAAAQRIFNTELNDSFSEGNRFV